MKFFFFIWTLFFSINSLAIDCSKIPPFTPIGLQFAEITASRIYWVDGIQKDENLCKQTVEVPIYDVKTREEEAFYCLKPKPSQVLVCSSKYLGKSADVYVIPASWIRSNKSGRTLRTYRFHSYIQPPQNPKKYLDIFSRQLSFNLLDQELILEGAKRSGSESPSNEGFWFRVKFLK